MMSPKKQKPRKAAPDANESAFRAIQSVIARTEKKAVPKK